MQEVKRARKELYLALRPTTVELLLDKGFAAFTDSDKDKLQQAIRLLLNMQEGVFVLRARQGTVIATVQLAAALAPALMTAVYDGKLRHLGVIDAAYNHRILASFKLLRTQQRLLAWRVAVFAGGMMVAVWLGKSVQIFFEEISPWLIVVGLIPIILGACLCIRLDEIEYERE